VDEWIEAHLAYRRTQGDQERTEWMRRRSLQRFSEYCRAQHLSLAGLQAEHIRAYQQYLLWKPNARGRLPSSHSLHAELCVVRTFLRWSVAQGVLPKDPTASWLLRAPVSQPHILLSRTRLQDILDAPCPATPLGLRDRAVLAVICELGIYSRGCSSLSLSDFEPELRQLKGLRLGAHLLEALVRYLRQGRSALLANPDEAAFFLTERGRRMSHQTLESTLYRQFQTSARTLRKSWLACHEALLTTRLPRHLTGR
jgi:integrase/recombinase XerD